MAKTIELTVPDLGGFDDVPIIEILVASGDAIGKDAPLVMLESDKATMEVPASAAGTIREIRVKIGDRVSQGTVLANVEVADDTTSGAPQSAPVVAAVSPPETASLIAPDAPIASTPHATNGAVIPSSPSTSAGNAPSAGITSADVIELVVPDLAGLEAVPVITVFVQPGDTILKDAPLVELESDKATMEVPALRGGVIAEVRVKVGDKVAQGTILATLRAPQAVAPLAAPVVTQDAASEPESSAASLAQALPEPTMPAPVLAAVVAPAPPSRNGSSNGTSHGPISAPLHASPAIRRFARELGVSLDGVKGGGPNGRITREDVQSYVKVALARTAAPAPAPTPPPAASGELHVIAWPKVDFAKFGPIERKPLSRIAKLSGQNLARNWVVIPHVTQNDEADVTELEAFRKATNAEHKDAKITMLAFLMKALVSTLRVYPNFNSSLDGDELVLKQYYHLGFAADTPNGLVVPVIRDVDKKGVLELAIETATLAKKAREGKLGPVDMTGSTFTISSLGGIGGTSFTPIINAPEVAILGVSRSATKPVWNGSAFVPRLLLPLSLSYDHRVIDGAAAARFCAHLAGVLADLRKTLL